MRHLMILTFCLTASAATAHPGHFADAAGHNHWAAGAAIALAGLAVLLGALKDRKDRAKA